MLTMADEGGRGGLDAPFLADIICEQPLNKLDYHNTVVHPNVTIQMYLHYALPQQTCPPHTT